ncbi:MAG: PASTA domain-containing protein, partial [Hyphomicrobiales bacterium]
PPGASYGPPSQVPEPPDGAPESPRDAAPDGGTEPSAVPDEARPAEPGHARPAAPDDARHALPSMGPELEPLSLDELAPEVAAPPRGERRRGIRFNLLTGTLVLSLVALVGGFLIVNVVLMPTLTRQGAEVRVPEVTGLSEREAERVLAEEDLRLSKISEQWSPDVPRGFISLQDPASGSVVKRGRRISVIVSLGAQGTSVPVIDGNTVRQAEILLESAGLKQGKIARAYADDVGKDLVIASDPPGETLVQQETSVDLLVSLGPMPREYVLPDLTGKNAATVARGLRDDGFAVIPRDAAPGQAPPGVISEQVPPAGHRIAPRDSLTLYFRP